jgi:transposase-like protein
LYRNIRFKPALEPGASGDPTRKVQLSRERLTTMSLSRETDCPECDSTEFYKSASTRIHLGTKKKWSCTNCGYGFVTINGINTAT